MKYYPHPIIAKEGWSFIAISFLLSGWVHCAFGFSVAWFFWFIFVMVLQFFRDPAREIPTGLNNAVLSPADGRIVCIEQTQDPYLNRDALKISVFMNVFNVHSNRSPVDGEIQQIWYNEGKFLNADLDKASLQNERNALWIKVKDTKNSEENQEVTTHDVVCVQIAGLVARRILCYVKEKHILSKGERYGFIRFGSRVDLYLPISAKAKVSIGDKVSATTTVLAEL